MFIYIRKWIRFMSVYSVHNRKLYNLCVCIAHEHIFGYPSLGQRLLFFFFLHFIRLENYLIIIATDIPHWCVDMIYISKLWWFGKSAKLSICPFVFSLFFFLFFVLFFSVREVAHNSDYVQPKWTLNSTKATARDRTKQILYKFQNVQHVQIFNRHSIHTPMCVVSN